MARIQLDNVSKEFPGRVTAVRHFSLEVKDGEFVVLVGPSGCGKSTTLRMIAGLEEVTSGTITIGDRVVNDVHPKDRDIAMVFQNYALYPHMTVYKNMAFALRLRKEPRQEVDRKVREAAAILGIHELLDRKPKALSGGQRQRVALGRAIVRQPKAFLFDEPLSNLDAKLRIGMRGELKRLHMRLKTTTVYVTHDQEEAMTLGDRVVVMNDATIQQVGAPLEVYERPCNQFVAGFVGMPPMNFLTGRLESCNGDLRFQEEGERGIGLAIPKLIRDRLDGSNSSLMVTLGIRPEALQPIGSATHREPALNSVEARSGAVAEITARVLVVEPLGDRMDLHMQTAAGHTLIARIPAQHGVQPESDWRFRVDSEQLHFFESGPDGASLFAPHQRVPQEIGT